MSTKLQDGRLLRWVERQTSAYGFSSCMEKSFDGVAAANFAAAESFPTLPGQLQPIQFIAGFGAGHFGDQPQS
jgi:hypothetical protein